MLKRFSLSLPLISISKHLAWNGWSKCKLIFENSASNIFFNSIYSHIYQQLPLSQRRKYIRSVQCAYIRFYDCAIKSSFLCSSFSSIYFYAVYLQKAEMIMAHDGWCYQKKLYLCRYFLSLPMEFLLFAAFFPCLRRNDAGCMDLVHTKNSLVINNILRFTQSWEKCSGNSLKILWSFSSHHGSMQILQKVSDDKRIHHKKLFWI